MIDIIMRGGGRLYKGHREVKTLWTNCGFFSFGCGKHYARVCVSSYNIYSLWRLRATQSLDKHTVVVALSALFFTGTPEEAAF